MKLKVDGDGHVVLEEGHPVYTYEDGSEAPFDAAKNLESLNNKIKALEEEKDRHYKKASKLKKELDNFKDVDLEKYNNAMEKFKAIEDQKLVDEKGVEALKKSMRDIFDEEKSNLQESYKTKVKEQAQAIEDHKAVIRNLAVNNRFATSKYFSGDNPVTIYPPSDAAKIWGSNFDVRLDGTSIKVIAKDNEGKPILSKKNHGEPANFEEAIGQLVEQHARKNAILRSARSGGPVTSGNIDASTGDNLDNKSSTEKIKAGLLKHRVMQR